MATPAETLKKYFRQFDGSKNWESCVKAVVEELYHPDLTVITSDGEKDREAMIAFVKKFTMGGGKAENMSVVEIESGQDGKVRYGGSLVHGDGTVTNIDSLGSFKDGMLNRIEPTDPAVYSKMLDQKGRDPPCFHGNNK